MCVLCACVKLDLLYYVWLCACYKPKVCVVLHLLESTNEKNVVGGEEEGKGGRGRNNSRCTLQSCKYGALFESAFCIFNIVWLRCTITGNHY